MNYIKHLTGFFDKVATDERLNPTHVSMYVSLFQFWNANRFINPISISRNELMKVSKISAKATYHKCMKELNEWQYLQYKPSYNPFKGSLVYLFNFQSGEIEKNEPPNLFNSQSSDEQALVAHRTKIGTGVEQAQEPYINSSNSINKTLTNLGKQTKKSAVQKSNSLEQKEKLRQKKKSVILRNEGSNPTLKQVQEYFKAQSYPLIEAQKFYNYFQSNGWLIGGKTKMKNWQAAANNWMLNAQKFNSKSSSKPTLKNLNTKQNKNYNEPL